MHIKKINILNFDFPKTNEYPFNLEIFKNTKSIELNKSVTFFAGENGSGKSTLLKAISRRCGIYIWENNLKQKYSKNKHSDDLYKYIDIDWNNGNVQGSFFASEIFKHFAQNLDEWAISDDKVFDYFGGKSLISKSHGESHISYFKNRYKIKGLYLLDEPENALSPKKQIELMKIIKKNSGAGHAQFIIATHSPLLMAFPEATILSFDNSKIRTVNYKQTEHFKIYNDFFKNREKYLENL